MSDRFTADKLAWIEQITRDPELGHFAARVGVIIASHLNRETGEAFPGQERLADLCGATERGVRKAVGELAERQHLMIEVSAGRGRVCRYRPILHTQRRNGGSSFDAPKSGTVVPVIERDKRNQNVEKGGTVVPTNPLKEPFESNYHEKPVCVSSTHKKAFQDEGEALAYVWQLITNADVEADPRKVLLACQSHHGDAWPAKLHTWTLGAIGRSAEKPKPIAAVYDGPAELRADALKVGGDRIASYVDHYCRWREEDRTLMCRNSVIADTIVGAMGETWLASRKISIELLAANDAKPVAARRTGRVGWV